MPCDSRLIFAVLYLPAVRKKFVRQTFCIFDRLSANLTGNIIVTRLTYLAFRKSEHDGAGQNGGGHRASDHETFQIQPPTNPC